MKILVDKMPEKVCECSLAYYDPEFNGHLCSLQQGILCNLAFNLPCKMLFVYKETKKEVKND